MQLKVLNSDEKREQRQNNFSRAEKRRMQEEQKRKQVLEEKRKKLQEEQRNQEEKYKEMEQQKLLEIQKQQQQQQEEMQKKLMQIQAEQAAAALAIAAAAVPVLPKGPPTKADVAREARLAVCWLEWLSACNIPLTTMKRYAVTFTLNNLLPSVVAHFTENQFYLLGITEDDHIQKIISQCSLSSTFIFSTSPFF